MSNASGSSNGQEPQPNPNPHANQREVQLLHPCNYCSKAFKTPQALGGHQNSHRREKVVEKLKHRLAKNRNLLGSSTSRAMLSEILHIGDCMGKLQPIFQQESPTGFQYLPNFAPAGYGYGFVPAMQMQGLMAQLGFVEGQVPMAGNPFYCPHRPPPPIERGVAWKKPLRELNLLGNEPKPQVKGDVEPVESVESVESTTAGAKRRKAADANGNPGCSGNVDLTLRL